MSRLVELIQQYCPYGVEYVKLGDFATQWYRGAGIKKDEVSQEGIPCIRYGEIHTSYKIWFDKCVSHTDEAEQLSRKYADYGDILFAITSEDIPFIGNSVAYVGKERILVGGDIVVMKHNQNPKYISYALSTTDAVQQKGKGKVKSKVVHTNVPSLKEIIIPLPPLPVQEEIVRILDLISGLQLALHQELQAELQRRVQQYSYYREEILTHFNPEQDAKVYKLGDICELGTGSHNTQDGLREGAYPFYTRGIEILYLNSFDFDETAIITAGDGAGVGKVFHYVKGKYALHQRAYRIVPIQSKVLARYLYYYLETEFYAYIIKSSVSSSVTSIRKPMLLDFPVLLPSLSEQQRIVSILDRFDSLANDLSQGLPVEIEKRSQQYEYFRDKLLTFKRKEA